jgi:hypothetical protein
MRTGYGWTMRRMSSSVLYVSGKDKLTMCGISNTYKLCDDYVSGSNSGVKNEGGESHLKTVTSFAKYSKMSL